MRNIIIIILIILLIIFSIKKIYERFGIFIGRGKIVRKLSNKLSNNFFFNISLRNYPEKIIKIKVSKEIFNKFPKDYILYVKYVKFFNKIKIIKIF